MAKFIVTVSKDTAIYEIEADNEDAALDIAEEYYNSQSFELSKTS